MIQIVSSKAPFTSPRVAFQAVIALGRADALRQRIGGLRTDFTSRLCGPNWPHVSRRLKPRCLLSSTKGPRLWNCGSAATWPQCERLTRNSKPYPNAWRGLRTKIHQPR